MLTLRGTFCPIPLRQNVAIIGAPLTPPIEREHRASRFCCTAWPASGLCSSQRVRLRSLAGPEVHSGDVLLRWSQPVRQPLASASGTHLVIASLGRASGAQGLQ